MPRAVALGREQHAARDDRERADDERRPHRLAEEDERDRDGDERRRADRDRRARRADLAHREREEHLRGARREQPGEEERPDVMHVVPERRRHEGDAERGQHRGERGAPCVAAVAKPDPDRDRHPAEERRRGHREQDGRHAAPGLRTTRMSASAAAGSAITIPAMITAQPSQARPPSRSPASVNPKNAVQTGSSENASAVCVAVARRCAQVCARNASALAKTPVTSSAPQTVQPCGHASCPATGRNDEQAGERSEHLDERERDRVVARGEPLHQDDLQRVDRGAREHEQVSAERARVHAAREQREPGGCEHHADPRCARGADPEEHEREQRRQHDVHPGDEAGRRDRRPLEPGRLQDVAAAEQRAGERPGAEPRPSPSARSRRRPTGASVQLAIAKRSARNAKSGYSATASLTWTNVTPQTAVTATRTISARTRAIKRCLTPSGVGSPVWELRFTGWTCSTPLDGPLRDLRISVTDRCNFRCVYCMPKEVFGHDHPFLERRELLTFEEIARVARVFVALGVQKIRITGGEPLVRRDLERLIAQLAALDVDLTLTTNGSLLPQKAQLLADAGLRAHHRQPRLSGRRAVPRAERRRVSRSTACSRASRPHRAPGCR